MDVGLLIAGCFILALWNGAVLWRQSNAHEDLHPKYTSQQWIAAWVVLGISLIMTVVVAVHVTKVEKELDQARNIMLMRPLAPCEPSLAGPPPHGTPPAK